MEKDTNKPVQKPTFWNKALNAWGGSVLAVFAAQVPFMLAEIPTIITRIKTKKPYGEEGIAFLNKMNEMTHKVTVPAALLGGTIGWNSPEHEYLKDKNSRLQTENAELKGHLDTASNSQKSWAESEKIKEDSAVKVELKR